MNAIKTSAKKSFRRFTPYQFLLAFGVTVLALSSLVVLARENMHARHAFLLKSPPLVRDEGKVADEITRRLRRMGAQILRNTLWRPYDGLGELCWGVPEDARGWHKIAPGCV